MSSGFIKVVVMIRHIIICIFKTIGLQRKMSVVMIITKILQKVHLINKDSFLHLCGILDALLDHIAGKLVLRQVEHFAAHAVHCKIVKIMTKDNFTENQLINDGDSG